MTEENEKNEVEEASGLGENLSAIGQIIVGQIETVGGILTANADARAEGEFNTEVGSLHQEANKNLIAIENNEEISRDESNESGKDKSAE
ncbi:MAG TPA: hypothetical protein VNI84_14385 [Pyrinomonadaceae bacterium]|nr:hypothetical protein [Pyrinomonadaceae bacterium]